MGGNNLKPIEFLAVLVTCLASAMSLAQADMARGWYPSLGVNLGTAIGEGTDGVLAGVEISVPYMAGPDAPLGLWYGGYADVITNGVAGTRFSLGPEVGVGPLGLDGGYAGSIVAGQYQHGLAVRAALTVGYLALYSRYEYFAGPGLGHVGEFGVLMKFVFNEPTRDIFLFH